MKKIIALFAVMFIAVGITACNPAAPGKPVDPASPSKMGGE